MEVLQKNICRQLQYIPNDIILHLLSKLPVKSLIRFKCVSKGWCHTISNPGFNLSTENRRRIVISYTIPGSFSLHSIDIDRDEQEFSCLENLPKLGNNNSDHKLCQILGSCNGLLLVALFDNSIFMCNPSTMEYTYVFKCEFDLKLFMYGFCFDSSTKSYKLVVKCGEYFYVYCLNNGCKKVKNPVVYIPLRKPGIIVNGNLHWMVVKRGHVCVVIIYFDPVKDGYGEISTPPCNNSFGHGILGLGELNGCLALARKNVGFEIGIWVMKKYGLKETWDILFKFSSLGILKPSDHKLEPLCTTKDGEVLFTVNGERIVAYNPNTTWRRSVWIPRKDNCVTSVFTCIEGLTKVVRI